MTAAYIPAFETQRDEQAPTPWTNCNPASVAMLADQWTYGAVDTSDVAIRRASPVPLNRGMNYAQVASALRAVVPALGALQYSERDGSGNANITWAQLREHLAADGGAAVGGDYSSLRGLRARSGLALDRWQPGGDFGHMVFVCDYRPESEGGDGTVLLMDPLGHGDYRGDRMPLDALWAYIWRNGNGPDARVTAAHRFAGPRPARRLFPDVDPAAWYAPAVARMARAGIMRGYADGTFRPAVPVTRGELAAILANAGAGADE